MAEEVAVCFGSVLALFEAVVLVPFDSSSMADVGGGTGLRSVEVYFAMSEGCFETVCDCTGGLVAPVAADPDA